MAGEIQLNSTTMATESSGSITAELDTIRPNTTNGSLTLQGDSSNAGVTGLTIDSSGNATFAQTISGGTIGSGVVFPAGKILNIQFFSQNRGSSTQSIATNNTYVNVNNGTNSNALEFSFTTTSETTKIYTQVGLSAGGNTNARIYSLRTIISKDSFSTTVTSTATEGLYVNALYTTNYNNRQNIMSLFNVDSSSSYNLRIQGKCDINLGSLIIQNSSNVDLLVLEYK